MFVSSVEKLLVLPVTWKYMKKFTLELNLMHVKNVGKPSIGPESVEYMH
jgi:hypothetical protein